MLVTNSEIISAIIEQKLLFICLLQFLNNQSILGLSNISQYKMIVLWQIFAKFAYVSSCS